MTWRKIIQTGFGGIDRLELHTLTELPEPGAGEVRVRVHAASAAFTDTIIRKGMYPDLKQKPPFTPGYDMVGVVDAVGPGVTTLRVGERVADLTVTGAHADYLWLAEDRPTRVPDGVSDADALGMILSAVTPWQMLHRVAALRAGQSLLIHGAGGAVGTTMLQLARSLGITAYGTDVAAKHDLIRSLGATPLDANVTAQEARSASGGGVDAVFDPLGGDSLPRSRDMLKKGGKLVAFGFQNKVSGRSGSIPLDLLKLTLWNWLPNGCTTAFYSIGAMRRKHPAWFRDDLATLFGMLRNGQIAPVIASTYPLEDIHAAHREIEAGTAPGKIMLQIAEADAVSARVA
ncbi:MAG: zinc-binding dehydrogenase [Salinarimonas sp.]|nr:zinc-binding dehydrogenase [Salinarimonas sp.]